MALPGPIIWKSGYFAGNNAGRVTKLKGEPADEYSENKNILEIF